MPSPPAHQAAFAAALKSLQAQHLGSTLKLLSPVNRLPIFSVKVQA
jgi:hypothetical protein